MLEEGVLWTACCGLLAYRDDGRFNVCCAKELDRDFLYMCVFVFIVTLGVALYAAF